MEDRVPLRGRSRRKSRARTCGVAPVQPQFTALMIRADAHVAGAFATRQDLAPALARYEAARSWTWDAMGRDVALVRSVPAAGATPHDVLTLTAELLRAVPHGRAECERCRACFGATKFAEAAHAYTIAVRAVWCALTGMSEW